MKLFYAPASPYARKVLVVAHELGLADAIETVSVSVTPIAREAGTAAHNPLGKVPTLVTDTDGALFDSRVICEYLDARSAGPRLFPADGPERWAALGQQALADGLLDAALLTRYERAVRPEHLRWDAWDAGQIAKVAAALDRIESLAPGFAHRIGIGPIAVACALGYLDFRFPDLGWRSGRPAAAAWFETFGQRPSMAATRPPQA
ncbi:glutathione S-transferase [Methylobacterium trifolii]|nr:glutathione S-transferase [Methylobacterium trifolii]